MIRRLLPYPALAVGLLVMWLLLTQSFSPGQVLLGALVATAGNWAMAALHPRTTSIRKWREVVKLAGVVAFDILRSNLAVATIVLTRRSDRTSSFLNIPLDLRNEHGLTILALIITATPGTAWVQFDRASTILTIHVFDLVDEEEWIRLLKSRYEASLMAIFES